VTAEKDLTWAKWAQAVTQMVFYGCYTAFIGKPSPLTDQGSTITQTLILTPSPGPVCYSIVGEASSTRLRNKSVALGRITYAIFTLVMNILNTYMINASAWNWRGKTAFFCEFSLVLVSPISLFICSDRMHSFASYLFSLANLTRAPHLRTLHRVVLLSLA
jgi:hypothetical protein